MTTAPAETTPSSRSYLFHGLTVTVSAEAPVLAVLHDRLGRFPESPATAGTQLRFEFRRLPEERDGCQKPAGPGRIVMEMTAGQVWYFEETDQLYVEFPGRGRALCDLQTRSVQAVYAEATERHVWMCSHPLFTITLAELLKREGLYMVHAAGLAHGGRGLLAAGASGAGKTTLAIALLRAGFGFMGDDTVLLTAAPAAGPTSGGWRVLAFPDEMDLTDETIGFFPELRERFATQLASQRPKRPVCATLAYGVQPHWECAPAMLVFPRTSAAAESVLVPMPKAEALLQLLPNVVRTERRATQAHLDAVAALVQLCPCFQLHTGRDFDALPARLRAQLDGAKVLLSSC